MPAIHTVAGALRVVSNTALGAAVGRSIGAGAATVAGAGVGALTGVVHGRLVARHRVYPDTPRGWALLAVDHTWSLVNTGAGAVYATINAARGNPVDSTVSEGRTSLVFRDRFLRNWSATTIGPVEAGTTPALATHEFVHVTQARLMGPFYGPLVVGHYVVAALVPYWWRSHDHERWPIENRAQYFRRGVYRHVWNEDWAYRADGTGSAALPRSLRPPDGPRVTVPLRAVIQRSGASRT